MKLSFLLILTIALFIIISCGSSGHNSSSIDNSTIIQTDAEAVETDRANLEIIYADGDNYNSVTQNIELPTSGSNDTSISWQSNNVNIISNTGIVTRPIYGNGNTYVTLTATISKGEQMADKVFNILVIEAPQTDAEAVNADTSSLEIIYSDNDNATNVTGNILLSVSGENGTSISWSSDTPTNISDTGIVTRPDFGSGNITVIMTATISKGSISSNKTFTLIVIETPPSDREAVDADTAVLNIIYGFGDKNDDVIQNIGLPSTGNSGTSINWVSDNSAIVVNSEIGVVTRPEWSIDNTTVNLTATISKGVESSTKEFNLKVKVKYTTLKTGFISIENKSYSDYDDKYYDKGIETVFTRDNVNDVVTENVTGLMWQDDSHCKDEENILYWSNAFSYCSDLIIGENDDWRLPSIEELWSIVYKENVNNTNPIFLNTSDYWYWGFLSSTTNYPNVFAWDLRFSITTRDNIYDINNSRFLDNTRCVRGVIIFDKKFERNNSEQVVIDRSRGLMWQDNEVIEKAWEESITYCEDLSLSNYEDWRLPNKNELMSIVAYNEFNPAINDEFQILKYGEEDYYWSSTSYDATHAYISNFYTGKTDINYKPVVNFIRCVRDLK